MSIGVAVSGSAVCRTIVSVVVAVAGNPKLRWNSGYSVMSSLLILAGPLPIGSSLYIESHPIYQVISITVHIIDTNGELEWALYREKRFMTSVGIYVCVGRTEKPNPEACCVSGTWYAIPSTMTLQSIAIASTLYCIIVHLTAWHRSNIIWLVLDCLYNNYSPVYSFVWSVLFGWKSLACVIACLHCISLV